MSLPSKLPVLPQTVLIFTPTQFKFSLMCTAGKRASLAVDKVNNSVKQKEKQSETM